MKLTLLLFLCTFISISCRDNQERTESSEQVEVTIKVDPENVRQEVVFGGDGKLSIKDWAEQALDGTSAKLFRDINLEILRIPIFTRIAINDPIYDLVGQVVQAVQKHNPDVRIFASVGNGDGYEHNNLHREEKFPDSWIGCCPENVYKIDLEKYVSYLDSFMVRMSEMQVPIHYLGPFNEDKAFAVDYDFIYNSMNELGDTKKINLERYSLSASVSEQDKVGEQTDIIGSHYFDDNDQQQGKALWSQLVEESEHPVWFTESTRFKTNDSNENLMNGLNHIFPAITAGVEAVIFYQVVPRFVGASGALQTSKYSGFKSFINSFESAHVVESSSSDDTISCLANASESIITVHLLNYHSDDKITQVKFVNSIVSEAKVRAWTDDSVMEEIALGDEGAEHITFTFPANSFVEIEMHNRK